MRRLAAAAALVVLAGAAAVPTFGQWKATPVSQIAGAIEVEGVIPAGGFSGHDFSHADYLRPSMEIPKATIVLNFSDGDTSFATWTVPTLDSLRNGTGRWADSTFSGADIRATVGLVFTNVGNAGTLSKAQLQAINARSGVYEIAAHNQANEYLGQSGLDGAGAQVSAFGVTGMSREFLGAVLGAAQDSAVAFGIDAFRTFTFGGWKQQPGMTDIWLANGFYQAFGQSTPVEVLQASMDAPGYTAQQRNYDPFIASAFNLDGNSAYDGFHRMGERHYRYDLGMRSSWDRTGKDSGAVPDTLEKGIDMISQLHGIWPIVFHKVVPTGTAGADNLAIEYDEMLELIYFIAQRITEGTLQSRTAEQAAALLRAQRIGNLAESYGFTLLQESKYTSPLTSSIDEPIGMVPVIGSNSDFYASPNDTLAAPSTAAISGQWKAWSLADSNIVLTAFTATSSADSVTYGVASSTGNVIVQQGGVANTDGINLTIQTSGCKGRAIVLSVQVLPLNQPAPNSYDAGDYYWGIKAGQFRENWQDNVNGNIVAYECMADIMGGRADPDFSTFAAQRQRVRAQFVPWLADTSSAPWINDGTPIWTTTQALARWLSSATLTPTMVYDRGAAADWDALKTNYGNNVSLYAAGSASEAVDDNLMLLTGVRVHLYQYQIDIDDQTDYVQVYMGMERNGTNLSAAAEIAVLGWEAVAIP